MTDSLRIGTLGTGRMAENLGQLWADKGHQLFFGSRNPEKAKELANRLGPNANGGTQAEAKSFGQVILLAVPWTAAEATVKSLVPFDGKLLIDMTNPVKPSDSGVQMAVGHTTSLSEEIAVWATGAKVVKAFNSIYFGNLVNPRFGTENASSFFCGDDNQAKAIVAQLSRDIGFDPVDSGPLVNARLLEPLAALWMQLASLGGNTDVAFKLLRR